MKKFLIGIAVVIVIAIIAFVLSIGRAPEDVKRADIVDPNSTATSTATSTQAGFNAELQQKIENFDLANLHFKFTGYGPGKSHEGTFTGISVSNIEHNNEFITKGTIKFFANSVDTNIGKLDSDLCGKNFFDCPAFPEIVFRLTDVTRNSATELTATGNLTMKGITKQVSFPIAQNGDAFSADFILDVNQFGFTAPGIVDNEARIQFDATL